MSKNFKKNNFKKRNDRNKKLQYKKISEFYVGKYDDLNREERAILSQMDLGDREFWHLNHFRNIPSMKNDGEKIAGLLAGLAEKGYIVRNQRGGTGYKLMER